MENFEFVETIKNFIVKHHLFVQNEPIIVALSGGADSVALLLVLRDLGYCIHALHCNFHLRGEESLRDEKFVRNLCAEIGVDLTVKDFNTQSYAHQNHLSIEMACRDLRYAWFNQFASEMGYSRIAVAHHSDDSIETFFLNVLRGSGIAGLAAIKPINGDIVRPLLCVTRNDILNFLERRNHTFVTDSSNLCCDFKRNKLRNVALPHFYSIFPEAKQSLLTTISNVQSCNALYSELLSTAIAKICIDEKPFIIKIDELLKFNNSETLLFEILRNFNFNSVQASQLYCSIHNSGKRIVSQSHTATISRSVIEVCEISYISDACFTVDLNSSISYPIEINVTRLDATDFSPKLCNGKSSVCFDSSIANQNLFIRHWLHGDRIKPFGMKGSKLVSDVFSDLKLSNNEKQNAWLLTNDHNEVLWIIGYKSSNLNRVRDNSDSIICLNIT